MNKKGLKVSFLIYCYSVQPVHITVIRGFFCVSVCWLFFCFCFVLFFIFLIFFFFFFLSSSNLSRHHDNWKDKALNSLTGGGRFEPTKNIPVDMMAEEQRNISKKFKGCLNQLNIDLFLFCFVFLLFFFFYSTPFLTN